MRTPLMGLVFLSNWSGARCNSVHPPEWAPQPMIGLSRLTMGMVCGRQELSAVKKTLIQAPDQL